VSLALPPELDPSRPEPQAPASAAQIPISVDPARDDTPLDRMRAERERRRRRVGWLVIFFMVPGLAFPLLSRRPARSAERELRQACAQRCTRPMPHGVGILKQCYEQCLSAR
jgi:hypothetical protein